MKITLAQINPTIGDLVGNIELMRAAALKAQSDGADMVVFPELSLTGYYPGDLLNEAHFQRKLTAASVELLKASTQTPELAWVVGLPVQRPGAGSVEPYHNSLMVLRNGRCVQSYDKQLLPTYNVFDERRHFQPGPEEARVVKVKGVHVGLLICEDGWNDEGQDYKVNPFERMAQCQPDLVVSINASPSHIGKREERFRVFSKACARHKLPLVYVNQVGGHDQLVYDGASFVMDASGAVVFEAKRFDSDVTTLTFDEKDQTFSNQNGGALPLVSREGLSKYEFYRQQIILGLRDYARRCGFTKAVVGSSGGIDSALTLALATQALGADNVVAITMPSEYSSAGSVQDSVALCDNLGIKLYGHSIGELVNSFEARFSVSFQDNLKGIALENIQARIRGTALMAYSNMYGHLLLTTGNKSEVSVGYCTLYGDTNGGLSLIGDLYKTEVFELCRHINEQAGRELIPVTIIDKEPSAELSFNQKDSDSLPPYPVLDAILKHTLEARFLSAQEQDEVGQTWKQLERTADGRALIERVQRLIARSEYKRRQAPPVLRVRGRAFGIGRQVPISAVQF